MSKITPCLWFEDKAEEATRFYVSLLPDSRIDHIWHSVVDYPGGRSGAVLLVEFTLAGASYQALNGGPYQKPTAAVSLSVSCEDQAEVDRLWDALLTDGGAPMQCGWLTDRYGFAWQIVPRDLEAIMRSGDREGIKRATLAMFEMVKLDMAALQRAYDGEAA